MQPDQSLHFCPAHDGYEARIRILNTNDWEETIAAHADLTLEDIEHLIDILSEEYCKASSRRYFGKQHQGFYG